MTDTMATASRMDVEVDLPWLEPPFENGKWRKVKSLSDGKLPGSKFLVTENLCPAEFPTLPADQAFVVRRSEKAEGGVLALGEARAALAVQQFCSDCIHIGKVYGAWQDTRYIYTATEYCPLGEVMSVLTIQKAVSGVLLRKIAHQMLLAVQELHVRGLAHLDICLENFHVTTTGTVKLVEFASTTEIAAMSEQDARRSFSEPSALTGQPIYRPPEMCPEAQPLREKFSASQVDSFQIGLTISALLAGQYPALSWTRPGRCDLSWEPIDVRLSAHAGDVLEQLLAQSPARDMLEQLLAQSPEERMEVKSALEHPWFQS